MSRTYRSRKYTFQEKFNPDFLNNADTLFIDKLLCRYYTDNNFMWKHIFIRSGVYLVFLNRFRCKRYNNKRKILNEKIEIAEGIELLNDLN